MTKEDKIKFLTEHGWTTLWTINNWVKEKWIEHSVRRIKKVGYDLDTAYNKCLKENETPIHKNKKLSDNETFGESIIRFFKTNDKQGL